MQTEMKMELVVELKAVIHKLPDIDQLTDDQLRQAIEDAYEDKLTWARETGRAQVQSFLRSLTFREKQEIFHDVYNSIRGLGLLDKIMRDPSITEIMINGYDSIFVERRGGLERLNDKFESTQRLIDIIGKFVGAAGRGVNDSNPIVDTRLADGSRVNVVLPPVALNGPIVTIRRFMKDAMTMEKLIELGSLTQQADQFLHQLVLAKYNIFISGGTGSGKTTFLNALSNYIPSDERIITIEDSAELQIKNIPNLVRLETRNASAGAVPITIRDLIKSSLRMRPERIVVGEVRGAEALDMLQAMNTGHDGSLSTGHANSTRDMLSRLETMVLTGSGGLPLESIRQQVASAVDIIIHLSRMRDRSRKTVEITEVVGYENGQIQLNPLFQFQEEGGGKEVRGRLNRTGNPLIHTEKMQRAGITGYLTTDKEE